MAIEKPSAKENPAPKSQDFDLLKKIYDGSGLTPETAKQLVTDGLKDADYGEFYYEVTERESLTKDKGEYTNISLGSSDAGFGFRVGREGRVGYAYSDTFNESALKDAITQAQTVLEDEHTAAPQKKGGYGRTTDALYAAKNPMQSMDVAEKIAKLDEIEAHIKSLDPNVTNVTLGYRATSKTVHIITEDGTALLDTRPNVSLAIQIQVEDENGNRETGMHLLGGPIDVKELFDDAAWKDGARQALEQAKTLLIAEDAPAGKMEVVLNQGWPAVLLHEAIGHGLEGDFNRRGISVYSGKIGQKVAADSVTVADQGDLPGERGSLHFDDEGTPTQENILIENGILKAYMQDRQNALLMGDKPTGNGRRETFRDTPMPRMTNTYFKPGAHDPEDIIKSVKDGLYIKDMGGGQVDITSGKFNMNATLGYRIRDGKLCEPVKGATLVGDGLTVIQSIKMVGNDLTLEKSAGMCGKNGQSVIVGCGQPTVRVSNMTVGGTKK
ncbi:MAG: metalloprotease TldD [Micavibrio sp.]|nr:MAG: metalloprotease TldD [Micavibrio sp.]